MSGKITLLYIICAFQLTVVEVAASQYSAGGQIGYNNGPGFVINGTLSDFARDFPLKIRFGFGYSLVKAGNAADARKIFINDATNGDPEKSGRMWDFRFDFLHKVPLFSLKNAYLYGGPRYVKYKANFKFIGGNEDFDVSGNQWGLGLGLNNSFPMGSRSSFTMSTGVDYYFDSTLAGHDTAYSPDGEHRNSRKDYGYDDADEAIDQPELDFHILFGIEYRL